MALPRFAALLSLLLAATSAAAEEPVVLKLATLAPAGSSWHRRLTELSERWREASAGRVKLRIYPGGIQGSEGDMLRKLGVGQLDAASVSNVGLHDVTPEPQALTVPQLLEGDAEFTDVFRRLRPALDAALARKGLLAVQWARVGQIRLFCNRAVASPAEAARLRVYAWEGDPESAEAWRAAGLRPVVLSSVDLVPALQTGMIDCLAHVPVYALAARLFEQVRFMVDVPWAEALGATVIAARAWDRVPPELRPRLLAIAEEVGARVDADAREADSAALEAMKRQGLTVVPGARAAWRRMGEASWPAIRGKVIPAAFFDQVLEARDVFRRTTGAGAAAMR